MKMPTSKNGNGAQPAPALVLFDIDGTLIRKAGPHHRQALSEAVRRITGLESTTDGIPVQGMLDRDILTIMLRNAGATKALIRRSMPDLVRTAQSIYSRTCPNLERRVCPGVRLLLLRLSRRGIPAGLVTGNLSRIAWKKMEHAGLRHYFRFGVFAEVAHSRAALVKLALGRARREGWIDHKSRVSLIGDHPNDILAARANRIRAVAVATGLSTSDELATHGPDILVPDLRSLNLESLIA
jgi:phosphoglycolate phosphatase-like HAD superfamily hydrolase